MSPSRPRIVFMGTPDFAVPSLKACLEVGQVVAVVTQPDRPKGRGQTVAMSPVKETALAHGLPVLQPEKLKTPPFAPLLLEALRGERPDIAVVTAYGRILPKELLALPTQGCVNVHGSLLPRWRGAAPIQWALAHGDAQTGVCLMEMDEGLDTGAVIARRVLTPAPEETSASLYPKLAALGASLLREELPAYLAGERRAVPQPSEGVTLAPIIEKEEGRLHFERPAVELERRVRAFNPWPGTFTTLGGALFKVHEVALGQGRGRPGEILSAGAAGIEVACGEGSLVLRGVQPEGKRRMSAQELLTGRTLDVGSTPFGT